MLAFAFAAAAFAGTFDLTTDELVLDRAAGTVGVTNTGSDPILVHGTAFATRGEGGSVPTGDLVVSPAHLTIAPGETAQLRVAPARGPADAELAYELVVEELHLGIGYASMPVFLRGSRSATLQADVRVTMAEGTLAVDIRNAGDAHLAGYQVEVNGDAFAALRRRGAMLTGASRREVFFVPPAACADLTSLDVRLTSDAGTWTQTVPVDAHACARLAQASR